MKYQRLPTSDQANMANVIHNNDDPTFSNEHDGEPDYKDGNANNDYVPRSEVESLNFESAIPPGTIDPIYEAKARVLNEAVRSKILNTIGSTDKMDTNHVMLLRFKKLVWDGINGNYLSSLALAGQTIIYGQLLHH